MPDAFVTPDAIAVCQHPDGEELHVPLADMSGSCFCSNGMEYEDNHGVRVYVAVDALLSDATVAAVAAAQYAAEREIPVDPDLYANRLVQDEYTKFAAIGLRAAAAALTKERES